MSHPIRTRLPVLALVATLVVTDAHSQAFTSGSTGADGALVVTTNTAVQLPPDGVLNYTTVTIDPFVTLTFVRNELNTPVYMLATGNVVINGTVDVRGGSGPGAGSPAIQGRGGPGGFDGGVCESPGVPAGDGHGPGGGLAGDHNTIGSGSYATIGRNGPATYGSAVLMPLVGGSGSGGLTGNPPSYSSSGGGGAILIASSTSITVNGSINADGAFVSGRNAAGSGGAIRLVAPTVNGSAGLTARGQYGLGKGRIRIDAVNKSQLTFDEADPLPTLASLLVVFPDVVPRIDLVNVAGTAVAPGSGPVRVVLPSNAPSMQDVTIRATDFTGIVPVRLLLVPESGPRVEVDGQIDMGSGNPAQVTIQASFPANTVTHVYAYTR